mmetsp:Transcript_6621/g.16144  ORF Transcript_6621/g.16144 Transcript_6621/m.16144 type:complete len:88 (+) Transcript_6621:110-373(+)
MFFNFNMHENCKKREGKKSGKWPHHRKRARGRLVRVRDSLLILQLQRFDMWNATLGAAALHAGQKLDGQMGRTFDQLCILISSSTCP